ncbi:calcium/sodium antiporter [Aquicoccus porphyridii]|uniref:calcium/sodium antiporter n=1 Tax=Aquicoccus porphyridii TaxID=1852029 RepID=UPI00273CF926|nr:calcium/sodium antiporter [Aquicoccus porphyridii]
MIDLLWLVGGLVGLIVGGDLLVRGAVSVAQAMRISPMVIGLTLVGFGTSTPELVTSLQAAFSGSPGIAIGNVVGSNIGNILLILGLAALLRPVVVDPAALRRDGGVMLAATLLCTGVILWGTLGRAAGAVLIVSLASYLVFTILRERRQRTPAAAVYVAEADLLPTPAPTRLIWPVLVALAGLAITILGARFLVSGAVGLAEAAGISETVIGLTIVAIGTSTPELVTTLIAVRKGQGDVAFGNIIGSNIFNILGILGLTALIHPLDVPQQVIGFDIWVMLAATLVMLLFATTGRRIDRREGAFLTAAYATYLAATLWIG